MPDLPDSRSDRAALEAVRAACVAAALQAYEDAAVQGLCAEGCWEAAVGAIRSLDVTALPADVGTGTGTGARHC
jgi:hypothetical protein